MARVARVDIGNEIYHVINRAVGRLQIFHDPADYELFIWLMRQAKEYHGGDVWVESMVQKHNLTATIRGQGGPKKYYATALQK